MTIKNKIALFIVTALVSVWLGFMAFTGEELKATYLTSIYYFLTLEVIIWTVSIFNSYFERKKDLQITNSFLTDIKDFFKDNVVAIIISLILISVGVFYCKPDFRVLSDEAVILSDSKSLSSSKIGIVVDSAVAKNDGTQIVFNYTVDKRPLLFQYIVSLLHSVVGFNQNNAFIVNYFVGVLSLFLLYLLIKLEFGKLWGICGLILFSSFPLFLLCTSSAGFELFNLLCSLIFFLLLYSFIKTPTFYYAESLILFLPLIGQTRYESIIAIFVLPIVFWMLPKKEYEKFSYKMLFLPIFCIPIPWLRAISDNDNWWENENLGDVFGFRYIWDNFKAALEVFFSGEIDYGIISFVSFFAVLGFILWFIELFNKKISSKTKVFCSSVLCFYILHAIIRFMYAFVDFRVAAGTRLALIFIPLMVFLALYVFIKLDKIIGKKPFVYIIMTLILALPFIFWPDSLKHCGHRKLMAYKEYRAVRTILAERFSDMKKYCIVCDTPFLYTVLGYSSVEPGIYVALCDTGFKEFRKKGYFSDYLLIQRIIADKKNFEIPENLKIINQGEKRLDGETVLRFSYCSPKSE